MRVKSSYLWTTVLPFFVVLGCSNVEIIESPKTGFVSEARTPHPAEVVWTSRSLLQDFEYLGQVKTRSLSYDGAFSLLMGGAQSMKADALIDIHFEQIGFFNTMQAFAVKYK